MTAPLGRKCPTVEWLPAAAGVVAPSVLRILRRFAGQIHRGRDSRFVMSQGARSTTSRRHSTPRGVPRKVMVGAWVVHVDLSLSIVLTQLASMWLTLQSRTRSLPRGSVEPKDGSQSALEISGEDSHAYGQFSDWLGSLRETARTRTPCLAPALRLLEASRVRAILRGCDGICERRRNSFWNFAS